MERQAEATLIQSSEPTHNNQMARTAPGTVHGGGASRQQESSTVTVSGATDGFDLYGVPGPSQALVENINLLEERVQPNESQSLVVGMTQHCRIDESGCHAAQSADQPLQEMEDVCANERSSAKVAAAKLHHVCDAVDHKKRTDKHARSMMWACIFKIGQEFKEHNDWGVETKMKSMIFSDAVGKVPPLDFVFATTGTGGVAEDRHGTGRGRALGVVLRWSL